MVIVNNYYLLSIFIYLFLFLLFLRSLKMKSPIKLRYVLLATIIVFTFNGINNALKRSDYNHCLITSKMTSEQCQSATGYQLNK